jgi:hypothetical protein
MWVAAVILLLALSGMTLLGVILLCAAVNGLVEVL